MRSISKVRDPELIVSVDVAGIRSGEPRPGQSLPLASVALRTRTKALPRQRLFRSTEDGLCRGAEGGGGPT